MFKRTREIIRLPMKEKDEKETPKTYKCNICKEGWQSETDVEFHRRETHSKIMNKMLVDNTNRICMVSNQSIKLWSLVTIWSKRKLGINSFLTANCTTAVLEEILLLNIGYY